MKWFAENKEWLISGIGVFVISIVYFIVLTSIKRRYKNKHNGKVNISKGNRSITVNNSSSDIKIGSDRIK